MVRKSRLASTLAFILLTTAAQAGNFIRVDEDDNAARLQTAVTRYEKNGATVDLIGAIHIADKAYYDALNARFKTHDVVLFEMVGGEHLGAGAPAAEPEPPAEPALAEEKPDLSALRRIYDSVSNFLKLTGQAEAIDYTAKNFVHADLTLAEFNRLQDERKESLIGFALKAAKAAKDAPEPKKQPNSFRLLTALISGKSNLVKLEIVHTLGAGDDQIAAFAGESVIITDRNQRCLEVLNRELAAGRKNLGIFYGAAHFPDMEKRLLEQGFKRVNQEWMTAWDIPKAPEKAATENKEPS